MIVYHVSPERGSDSNPGTANHPFKTVKRAVSLNLKTRKK